MNHEYISFLPNIAKHKPNTLIDQKAACPFCDTKTLLMGNDVVEEDGTKLLIKNLYPVMEDTYPLVFIEHDTCEYDLSNYPKPILLDVIRYGLTKWLELHNSGQFSSVLFFKNHGPHSGGSIKHPHMQIIGLYKNDIHNCLSFNKLEGTTIWKKDDFHCSLSHYPFTEGHEFTIQMKHPSTHLVRFSECIQNITHYILHTLNPKYKSFNLFFYHVKNEIICKISVRKPTSPIFMGYNIAQVPVNLNEVASDIQSLYSIS